MNRELNVINYEFKSVLFADDTSIIIYHPDSSYIQNSSKLTLNSDKANLVKFNANNRTSINFNIGYDNKPIEEILRTKFPSLQTVDILKVEEAH